MERNETLLNLNQGIVMTAAAVSQKSRAVGAQGNRTRTVTDRERPFLFNVIISVIIRYEKGMLSQL
jgi:hypothetical protein